VRQEVYQKQQDQIKSEELIEAGRRQQEQMRQEDEQRKKLEEQVRKNKEEEIKRRQHEENHKEQYENTKEEHVIKKEGFHQEQNQPTQNAKPALPTLPKPKAYVPAPSTGKLVSSKAKPQAQRPRTKPGLVKVPSSDSNPTSEQKKTTFEVKLKATGINLTNK